MKKILVGLSILVLLAFVIGCSRKEIVSDKIATPSGDNIVEVTSQLTEPILNDELNNELDDPELDSMMQESDLSGW
jgi:hypothetical protein